MNAKPKLLQILKEKGITQSELSRLANIPQGTVSRFDRNERHNANHLFAISKALNVNIEDLFEVTEEKKEDVSD